MAGRGWFEAISRADMDRFHALPLAGRWDFSAEEGVVRLSTSMDKAWPAIHAALSDGTLFGDGGEYPLDMAILGDHLVYRSAAGDFIYLKRPEEVAAIARSLRAVGRRRFEARFRQLPPAVEDTGNEDVVYAVGRLDYVWPYYEDMRRFYQRAAAEQLAVLFSWG
jgi:hypothetical protein